MSHLALQTDANRTTNIPIGRYGEQLHRYQGRISAPCDACDAIGLDVYVNLGASEGAAVCRHCDHQHTDQRTTELEQEAI